MGLYYSTKIKSLKTRDTHALFCCFLYKIKNNNNFFPIFLRIAKNLTTVSFKGVSYKTILFLVSCLFTFLGITMHLHELSLFRTTILEESKLKQKQELKYIRNHVSSVLYSRPQSTDLGLMLLNQTK